MFTTRLGNATAEGCHLWCLARRGVPIIHVRFPHHLVVETVETAFDYDDFVAPGKTPRGSDSAYYRFGA